jgi:hypothetical protein
LVSGSRIYPIEILLPPIEKQKAFSRIKANFNNLLNKTSSSQLIGDFFLIPSARKPLQESYERQNYK